MPARVTWKRFLGIIILFSLLLTTAILPFRANAQSTYYKDENINPDVPQSQHANVQILFLEMLSGASCILSGIDSLDPNRPCIDIDPTTNKLGYAQKTEDGAKPQLAGALGFLATGIGTLYTPPATTGQYIAYLSENFGISKTAYAQVVPSEQGYGFEGLRIFLRVFTMTRNIAYMLFILAFIIIGILIMLRVKIDPRTVMTVQNQIPKIIIGIILITFSYAIVGLMVDFMWTLTYVSVNMFTSLNRSSLAPDPNNQGRLFVTEGTEPIIEPGKATYSLLDTPFGFWGAVYGKWDLVKNVGSSVGEVAAEILLSPLSSWEQKDCQIKHPSTYGRCLQKWFYGFLEGVAKVIAWVIVAIALFVVLLRIWFMLLKAFGMIIIDTVTGPFWILFGLFPGSRLSFQNWLRHLTAHLIIFPGAVTMFLLAAIVLDAFSSAPNQAFVPPLIGNVQGAGEFGTLIGFGIILLIPDLLSMMRDALKQPPSQYGGNIRTRFTAGNPLGATAGLGQFAYQTSYIRQMPVIGGIWGKVSGARNKASKGAEGMGGHA